ncbi:MAG: U32 family peptidase [Clostridiales bacterium]|nr:U32 family peptidase [Clostridiales bacterium]
MKHELLAPAGSYAICEAVLAAGADAVYLGGANYGARAFAQNFSDAEILKALDLAHLHGKKIFLTVNTLLKNRETGEILQNWLKPFYEHGLDAIIVQDYGVFQFVRKHFPGLPVHASTQMSVANSYGAAFLKEQGASRIVTARELSLEEIRHIYDETGMEIESFVHGALCYCYSGQCLMSSLIGGRSGNRGRCAQPCRLPYQVMDQKGTVLRKKERYPLSPKDLCALELIPQICEAGVYSFKIEGRMKSLEYAAGVTQIYRKYLDLYENTPESFFVEEEDKKALLALGSRSGFTRGYYEMRNGRKMMALTDSSHSSGNAAEVYRETALNKIPVKGELILRVGEPVRLSLRTETAAQADPASNLCLNPGFDAAGESASRNGKIETMTRNQAVVVEMCSEERVMRAEKRPLSEEEVRGRLSKTGDTPFSLADLQIDMETGCFVPVKQLNELRRSAFCRLEQRMLQPYRRLQSETGKVIGKSELSEENRADKRKSDFLNVQVSNEMQLSEALLHPFVNMISLDFSFCGDYASYFRTIELARRRIQTAGKQAAWCFPYIFRENTSIHYLKKEWQDILRSFDTVWVRSYDSLGFCLRELHLNPEQISLDSNLYVFSNMAYRAFAKTGFRQYTASPELNQKELAHMPNAKAEFCIYGETPVMISAQCVYKNYLHCMKGENSGTELSLSDRYHKKFYVHRNCKDCYNVIYNSQPLYLFHHVRQIEKLAFGSYRITFVSEDREKVKRILHDYEESFLRGKDLQPPSQKDSFTNGHFRRGVD